MGGNVVALDEHRPHMSGEAVCLHCSHKWVGIQPVGALAMECPKCGLYKGVFNSVFMPDEFYECSCGNCNFFFVEDGAMCALCGDMHEL